MKRLVPALIGVFVLALTIACPNALASPQASTAGLAAARMSRYAGPPVRYKTDEVIVGFAPGLSAAGKGFAISSAGATGAVASIGPSNAGDTQLVRLRAGVAVEDAISSLKAQPGVAYAEPDYMVGTEYTPADPGFSHQWGLRNTGQEIDGVAGTPGADISATEAWDIEKGNTSQVKVAVVDSGADLEHPDLSSKLVAGYNWAGISCVDNPSYFAGFGDGTSLARAQSITGTGASLTHIALLLSKEGTPGDATISVRSSLSGANLAHFVVDSSEITAIGSSEVQRVYRKLSQGVTLHKGSTYYLVLSAHNSVSDYYYTFAMDNEYAEGDARVRGTSSWSEYPGYDLYFETNPNAVPHDDNGHGTHVSGIVGAAHNGVGVAGVSAGAKVMPLKALTSSGMGWTSGIADAIAYAPDNGAKVINISLGSSSPDNDVLAAVDYAHDRGTTVCAAAGNDGDNTLNYPAAFPHVIGVASTTNTDEYSSFSNFNASVDVAAPGSEIYSTMPTYPCMLTAYYYFNEDYDYLSGTSMATPMTSGLAALVLSKHPGYSPQQVEQLIESNAKDLGSPGRDDHFGHGRIDAYKTLSHLFESSTWYLAEGTSDWGFDTYVTIENPNNSEVTARVTYMTKDGPKSRPDVKLPAMSQTVINPRNDLGATDFSTRVVCKENKTIAVDRRMIWTGPGAASNEGHASVGVTSPSRTWYLPEGSSNWGFECWLLVQNPNGVAANVSLTYMIEGASPRKVTRTVPANSRASFNMADDIGAKDASVMISSKQPVIAERAMYRNNRREGHDSIGTTSAANDYYLAEGTTDWGFTTYLLVQNPNDSGAKVTLTYMTPSGPVSQEPFRMEANSRKTVKVNDAMPGKDFSTRVHADKPIIAERAMYWDNGTGQACHDSIGVAKAHSSFYLPDGETYNGKETWTLVQNPNSATVTIEISYLTPTGKDNKTLQDKIPANSRKTYFMADAVPNGRAAIMVKSKTSGKPIMVERAMYWNSRGAGTDTIGGYSD